MAIIGDSTFFHTGINSLLDIAYNQSNVVTVILDNRTTAMTGGQENPSMGKTLQQHAGYTDRAVNHMSQRFQTAMNDLSTALKDVYGAAAVAIVPGSGTFAMEAVARQFATGRRCLVVRNGWFSYRWTQIFEAGDIPAEALVLKARRLAVEHQAPFAPAPVEEVVATIRAERPDVVFAPHVETSSGMMLPDAYVRAVADADHEVGGLFVLDCIASGAMWVDMKASGVDVLISTAEGLDVLALLRTGDAGRPSHERDRFDHEHELRLRPAQVAQDDAVLRAGRPRLPRDHADRRPAAPAGRHARDPRLRLRQGARGAGRVSARGSACCSPPREYRSVAAPSFEAPSVVVVYTEDDDLKSGARFAAAGLQIAAGVPLQCDEPADYKSFG